MIVDGTLWQETPINLVRRDLETGEALDVIDKPSDAYTHATWFASIDLVRGPVAGPARLRARARRPAVRAHAGWCRAGQQIRDVTFGRDAIYFLTQLEVIEVEPRAE